MRKVKLFFAIPMAASIIGILAGTASAVPGHPGANYGACVSSGKVSPSSPGSLGPGGNNSNTPTGRIASTNAEVQSGGQNRFHVGSTLCPIGS